VKVVVDIALTAIIPKRIRKDRTIVSARFLRFIMQKKLDEFQNRFTMKKIKILTLPLLVVLFLSSCTSVRVLSDYDKEANFNSYKSYAFYKTGIDKAQISDLDKKRILKAIETEMGSRGFVKSDSPHYILTLSMPKRKNLFGKVKELVH